MSYKIFCFRADRELICMVCIKLNVNFNFVNNPWHTYAIITVKLRCGPKVHVYLNLLFDRNNDDFDVIILIGDNLALALMQIGS